MSAAPELDGLAIQPLTVAMHTHTATETGDRFVGEARRHAEQMVASARSTSGQMISEADRPGTCSTG